MAVRIGLDASLHIASCAVSIKDQVTVARTVEKPVEHLASLIRETLLEARLNFQDLEEIVACIGPGSNMGSRTTVVTGNALGLALGIPVTGVLSTDAMAVFSPYKGLQKVALPAGRGRFYIASYERREDQLIRISLPELFDELPAEDDFPIFQPDNSQQDFICAKGALLVAEFQRHLIEQSGLEEITTFQ